MTRHDSGTVHRKFEVLLSRGEFRNAIATQEISKGDLGELTDSANASLGVLRSAYWRHRRRD